MSYRVVPNAVNVQNRLSKAGQEVNRQGINPEDQEWNAPMLPAADVERAVQSARESFEDGRWRFLAPLEQERRLRKLAGLIAEHADELADLDVVDSGLLRTYAGFRCSRALPRQVRLWLQPAIRRVCAIGFCPIASTLR